VLLPKAVKSCFGIPDCNAELAPLTSTDIGDPLGARKMSSSPFARHLG
jgi:hypothetical protein